MNYLQEKQNFEQGVHDYINSKDKQVSDLEAENISLKASLEEIKTLYNQTSETVIKLQAGNKELIDANLSLKAQVQDVTTKNIQLADENAVMKKLLYPQFLGVNTHNASSSSYTWDKSIACSNMVGFKHWRQDFWTDENGRMLRPSHDDYMNNIYPKLKANGIIIHPVVYPKGFDQSSTDYTEQSAKAFKQFKGWETLYGGIMADLEINNEIARKIILKDAKGSDQSGRLTSHYDPQKLAFWASVLQGGFDGMQSVSPKKELQLSTEWVHFAFIKYIQANTVVKFTLSGHPYTDQELTVQKEKGYEGLTIEQVYELEFPGVKKNMFEVGYTQKSGAFSEELQAKELIAMLTRLLSKSYSIMGFELIDRADSGGKEATYGFFKSDGTPKLIVPMIKDLMLKMNL